MDFAASKSPEKNVLLRGITNEIRDFEEIIRMCRKS